jgi:hypothetical protein
MTPPVIGETLLLYIFATTNVVNTVLIAVWEEEGQAYPVQQHVYYVSEVRLMLRLVTHSLKSCSTHSWLRRESFVITSKTTRPQSHHRFH